ncbi:GNAT family N-acetyltransferase [Aggregicoccus sp. 17bor-14]|uniref:GNAT family N-acetyltransferase n=1 Tax=Myxococcaceae TaxID=31 RepID=UPI00129C94F2|nr:MULTISPECIES: GNAT family N-acetyltransferase [Myxococcaceae]MBF5041095.1 GNAT family N-acetyltransferase [Simulacricoccus sp. 17bor-14]MRI86882.1 GNAT family N-acetyltransferase [Aggregicoccus sp. 17bor-14]
MEALQLSAPQEAAAPAPQARVQVVTDRAAFMALEPEWNALVSQTGDELFYRHEFLRVWLDNFAPGAQLRVLTLREPDGSLSAALPLLLEKSNMYGAPVRQLVSAANPHSCRFDVVAREPEAAAQAFLAHLRQDRGWDVLRLNDVPEGGAGWQLHAAAARAGLATGSWESLQSPYFPLPARHDAFLATLQSKFKANCRRRRKKLEERGQVRFERYDGGVELDAKLEEGFALEASGWKGQRGTAMAQDVRTRGFYTELARESARNGRLTLYFLRLDDRAVAFQFGLTHGERYLLLKPGYDERLKECSPGQLLMEEAVRDCIARGVREFDFLGPDMVWKRDWTDKVRRHTWLYLFNDTAFARALCTAKFRWAPAAKEAAKEVVSRWKK